MKKYRELGKAESAFNVEFVVRVKRYQAEKPDFFKDAAWPLKLADEVAGKLGAGSAPAPTLPPGVHYGLAPWVETKPDSRDFDQPFVKIATSLSYNGGHTLGLKQDGTVVAWGGNRSGQATVPAGLTGVIAIAAGIHHSLALRRDGTVVGWGLNTGGQTTVPAGLTGVTAIAAGDDHSVALKSDGTVVAWGSYALDKDKTVPATVPAGLTGVKAIVAGFGGETLALKRDGTVVGVGVVKRK